MIKIGVVGAQSSSGGELLRILISHPEVEIRSLYSEEFAGRSVSSRHHGFIGEKIVSFSDRFDPAEQDIIFLAENSDRAKDLYLNRNNWPEVKIIDMAHNIDIDEICAEVQYGLSEINRKALVRGVKIATLPSPLASLMLIGLYPLASYLLLPESLKVDVAAPKEVIAQISLNESTVIREIKNRLNSIQKSFNGDITVNLSQNASRRVMRVKTRFKCLPSIEEILKIYDNIYDDHNFVFVSLSEVEGKEVEGTQKTIITLIKPSPDELEVEIVGDCRLRGGAGDAVHVLNLFFSLYEKIGLQLKPSRYGESTDSTSRPPSWFG